MLGVAPGLMEAFLKQVPFAALAVGQAVTHGGKGEACLAEAEENKGESKGDFHGVEVVKGLLEAAVDDDAGLGFGDGSHERFRGGAAVGDADADLARAGDGDEDAGEAFGAGLGACGWHGGDRVKG